MKLPQDCPKCGCNDAIKDAISSCSKLNCPYIEEITAMPVPVKRTLWLASKTGLKGHVAFQDLFHKVDVVSPNESIAPEDVIFFDGGTDVNPSLYGEKSHIATGSPDHRRDDAEIYAYKRGTMAGAQFLGTCRGAQLLCVLSGGKLVQHVSGHNNGGHMICTEGITMYTESSHHQVMWPFEIPHILIGWGDTNAQEPFKVSDEYGKDFPDGKFPEIIFCKDTRALCIQGHAEWVTKEMPFYSFTRALVNEYLLKGS